MNAYQPPFSWLNRASSNFNRLLVRPAPVTPSIAASSFGSVLLTLATVVLSPLQILRLVKAGTYVQVTDPANTGSLLFTAGSIQLVDGSGVPLAVFPAEVTQGLTLADSGPNVIVDTDEVFLPSDTQGVPNAAPDPWSVIFLGTIFNSDAVLAHSCELQGQLLYEVWNITLASG